MKTFNSWIAEGYKINKNVSGSADSSVASEIGYKPNDYSKKSEAELKYIMKDASDAAKAMKGHDPKAEAKYLDQVNDASTEMYRRKKGKMNEMFDDGDSAEDHSTMAHYHDSRIQHHAGEISDGPTTNRGEKISLMSHFSGDGSDHFNELPDHAKAEIRQHVEAAEEAIRKAHEQYHAHLIMHHMTLKKAHEDAANS